MGLLDSFISSGIDADPQQLGMLGLATGLLSASGPSRTPISMGQAMSAGIQGLMGGRKQALDQQKEAMQMDMLKQQISQATRKNSLINNMLAQYSGGAAGSAPGAAEALDVGAKAGDIGPTVTNAARIPASTQTSGLLSNIPREAIAHDIAFNDGKNISEWLFKRGTPDMQVSNGYAYDKNGVKPGFLPNLSVSQNGQATVTTIGPDGMPMVTAPKGALDTYSAYQDANEAAKAKYQTTTLPLPGGPRLVSNAQLPGMLNGQQAPRFQGQDIFEQLPQPVQMAIATQAREDGNLSQKVNYRLPDGRVLNGEVDFSKQAAPVPGIALENKDRTAVTNKLAADRLSTLEKDAQSQQDILSKLNIAERLINEGTFGNDFKSKMGMLGQNSGLYQTPQGVNTNLLSQIGNQLVLARGSLGAGVSSADADRYDRAAGDFSNAQSNEQRRKAISVMREIADTAFKGANAARSQYAETGTLPDYSAPKPAETKTYRDFGYSSPQDAIKDARNALLRYPSQRAEIIRRLETAGITQHGLK